MKRSLWPILALVGACSPASQDDASAVETAVSTAPTVPAKRTSNANCTLLVPPNPLSAEGLATPYQLISTDPATGPCHETNPGQAAFVQAAIFDPATSRISIYAPLVIDRGSRAAIDPVVPTLPSNAVVAIWFGFNGDTLTLANSPGADGLGAGHCVNGLGDSRFGQYAYCNAPAFFSAANQAMAAGKLTAPALGTAVDGLACPTVRDFAVVDQDPSDNVTATYLITSSGALAQNTAANRAALSGEQVLKNGSDEGLLAGALDGALGCKPWTAPDAADPGHSVTALPLNELMARARQAAPIALVPTIDPMVLVNGATSFQKTNLYRAGVDQPSVSSNDGAAYCKNLVTVAPKRMLLDKPYTSTKPSPDPDAANSLFTFLAQRFVFAYGPDGLDCQKRTGLADPVKVKFDTNGVAISADIVVP